MRIAPEEQRDFVGTLRVLEHCTFPWRQRAGGIERVISVGPEQCPTCTDLVARFGRWDHFAVSGGACWASVERWTGEPHPSLHRLKEEAAAAVDRRRHRKAAELLEQVALLEPNEPIWPLRAGQALHQLGEEAAAAAHIYTAAAAYAWSGAYQKAHAACSLALRLDPSHRTALALLVRVDAALLHAGSVRIRECDPSAAAGNPASATQYGRR